jgi:hypothetical protein
MRIPVLRHGQIAALALAFGLAASFLAMMPRTCHALAPKDAEAPKASKSPEKVLTPQSPEVMAAIEKGVKYLETGSDDARFGGKALQGIAILIHRLKPEHPKVVQAAEAIKKGIGPRTSTKLDESAWDIYSLGLSIIFLVELDQVRMKQKLPELYRSDVEFLLTCLQARQKEKKDGAWGYPSASGHGGTCDTSMTQYGVLSSWISKKAGYHVPMESIESVATWLLRTQDPSGGFGYQGNVAPGPNALVAQSEIRPSMTAAGAGSLYVCANFLDLFDKVEKRDADLPSALKEVKAKTEKKEKPKTKIELSLVREAGARAKKWMEANNKIDGTQWVHYFLYAEERCMTFREIFEGAAEKEPLWYDEGARFLLKSQGPDGSWGGQCGFVPDSAFSVLFLMRSTQKIAKAAFKFGEGTMIGGVGIPKDTSDVSVVKGRIVSRPLLGTGEALIAALERPDGRDFDKSIEILAELPGGEVERLAAKHGDKIRQLVGARSPEARLNAVKALSKIRDLSNVETLLYALTDPDPRVVQAANDGLLRIRRIPAGPALPDSFSDEDRRLLVEKWKAWYRTFRPDADTTK